MSGNLLIGKEERDAVLEVFDRQNGVLFAHGAEERRNHIFQVDLAEKELTCEIFRPASVALVSNGTAALKIALKAFGIESGDTVIMQPFNFISVAEVAIDLGAEIIWAELDLTLGLSVEWLDGYLIHPKNKPSAVIVTSMLGSLPNLERIREICNLHQIPMILDACESLGATYDNQDPALFADVACYSFDFGKTITAGEGGALVSRNQAVIDFAKSYRDHGHSFVPNTPRNLDSASFPGFNYRITELQAAILRVQLKKLPIILSLYSERWIAFVNNLPLEARDNYLRVENDHCKDLHDVIFLTNLSATLKSEIIEQVNDLEIGIKNVPNALRWHSAFYWQHIHPEVAKEHSVKLAQARLDDSIAINVDITAPIDSYKALGKIFNDLL